MSETKPVEEVTAKPADVIDSVTIEPVKSVDAKDIVESTAKPDESNKVNSTDMINKTTTTVTVNVTQTKVTVDDGNKDKDVSHVVTSAASIAEAAISAAEKIEQSTEKLATKSEAATTSDNDVEMIETNDDIEMKDISKADKPQTTTSNAAATVSKTAEADSVNNEAEHKIDDVEKNISNLFNGDDNVVSTNSKTFDESSKNDSQTGATSVSLKNGSNGSSTESPPDDVIKDNNDLVSILAGNDKSDDNIQAISSSQGEKTTEPTSSADAKNLVAPKSIENKLLKGISTPTSSSANVYNSTPIQKQFEISSENVSTISESAIDTEHILGDKSTRQEIISSHSSTINEKSSDLSTSSVAVTGTYTPND